MTLLRLLRRDLVSFVSGPDNGGRMARSGEKARQYKIGEVCKLADVQPYVLRYWETEFAALTPSKSGGGQRIYSQEEVDTVLRIKELLYKEGFTIAGAKKKLEQELSQPAPAPAVPAAVAERLVVGTTPPSADVRRAIDDFKRDLRDLLKLLQ